jgi:hypothetical protein
LTINEGIQLHFLPLNTDYELTNYKPDFMLQLWDAPAKACDALFYFDADIVVYEKWNSFLYWASCGVALCEDVNSPIPESHPKRMYWTDFYEAKGIKLVNKQFMYANGGFLGLRKKDRAFLESWKQVQQEMAEVIGGLNRSSLPGSSLPEHATGPFAPFSKTDQDALNITAEAWQGTISFVGKEGMAFKPGATLMAHAIGDLKPWKSRPIVQALTGRPPRLADRLYWKNAGGPIRLHTSTMIRFRKLAIKIASFIGRFYILKPS